MNRLLQESLHRLPYRLLFTILGISMTGLFSSNLLAEESSSPVITVLTVKQEEIRPSYPFPTFLSTGPYVWYENVKDKPIKGHTYRISTFSEERSYRIFVEKVEFGIDGCCLEIIDYRQLVIDEPFLNKNFAHNKGKHGFKLLRWIKPDAFEFEAFGGKYLLQNIDHDAPIIEELQAKKS